MSDNEYRPLKSPVSYEETMRLGQLYLDTIQKCVFPKNVNGKKLCFEALKQFSLEHLITIKEIPHLMDVFHYLTVEKGNKKNVSFNATIETRQLNDNDIEIQKLREQAKKKDSLTVNVFDVLERQKSCETEEVKEETAEPIKTSVDVPSDKYGLDVLKKMVDEFQLNNSVKKEEPTEQNKSDLDMLGRLNDIEINALFKQLGLKLDLEQLSNARGKHRLFLKFVERFGESFVVDTQGKFDMIVKFLDESRQ